MIHIPWRAGVTVATLVALTGCGAVPGTSGPLVSRTGFSLMVQAPEAYRGNGTVSMRFDMPRKSGYSVAALASDIERIDVALLEQGAFSMPPGIPFPTPVSMPAIAPQREPDKPPPTEPWPSDMEDFPTILPDNPTEPVGRPAPPPPRPMPPDMPPPEGGVSILPAPMPMPMPGEKPLVSSPVIAKASISRAELDKGQGDVVFKDLKAGVYGIQLVAVDREGRAIGKSMQSVEVLEGETAAVDTRLVLDGPSGSGNVSVGITIVEGEGGGNSGSDVATASPVLPPPPVPMPWPRKDG